VGPDFGEGPPIVSSRSPTCPSNPAGCSARSISPASNPPAGAGCDLLEEALGIAEVPWAASNAVWIISAGVVANGDRQRRVRRLAREHGGVTSRGRFVERTDASRLECVGRLTQLWRISVPSTFRHSRMNAASAVQPFAETIVPST
jgi:hypothetical protein